MSINLFFALVATVCLTQVGAISLQRLQDLNTNEVPAIPTNVLNDLEEYLSGFSGDIGRQATNTTAPTSQLATIISGLLGGLGGAIAPALGPLGPLATIFGPLISNALTGLVTNGLSGIGGILRREDLPNSGYETFLVNIPNQGSYVLMAKKPEPVAPAPMFQSFSQAGSLNSFAAPPQLSGLDQLFGANAFSAPQAHKSTKPNLMLIPLNQMSSLNGLSGRSKSTSNSLLNYGIEIN